MNTLSNLQASPAFKASPQMCRAGRPADAPAPAPPAPTPPPAAGDYQFSYNSQDEVVFPAAPATVHGVSVDGGFVDSIANISVEKAHLSADLKPNADGSFVYDAKDQANLTAAMSFAATAKTIEMLSAALGEPVNWAFQGKLDVNPDAGEDFNAYYARDAHSTNFFHGTDPKTKQVIMSGGSGEVVSHETGHALLDGLRPGYFDAFTPDVGAFHESFGDVMGILMALQDDRTVALCAQQTGGDLTKQNCVAATGEELGIAINDLTGSNTTGGDYVRNAINKFKSGDPDLGDEVHDLSRLWTGAFYDVLCGIQARNMAAGMDAVTALRATGNEGLKLYANLMKEAPQADFKYRDMANAFVASDENHNDGANVDLITKVMTDRKILGGDDPPSPPDPGSVITWDAGNTLPQSGLTCMTADGRKPLSDVVRPLTVSLSGLGLPELWAGAKVYTVVDKDGSLAKDAEVKDRVRKTVVKLIADGRVRYNDPNYKMNIPKDLFDAKGRPYVGITRWENGEMIIERNKVAT